MGTRVDVVLHCMISASQPWPCMNLQPSLFLLRPQGSKMASLKLASRWENVPSVRQRFRKGSPWLRVPKNLDGNEMPQSVHALKRNHAILMEMLKAGAGRKVKIGNLQKEAFRLQWETLCVVFLDVFCLWHCACRVWGSHCLGMVRACMRHTPISIYTCVCTHLYTRTLTYTYASTYNIPASTYVYMYRCIYIYHYETCIYIYVYIVLF